MAGAWSESASTALLIVYYAATGALTIWLGRTRKIRPLRIIGLGLSLLAAASGVSLPTIQRMEASNGTVRGVIESLTRVMAALEVAGVEFINEGGSSLGGGRGVRLRRP